MNLQKRITPPSEEKRAAIMTLAREAFSGAHIARHCGISEAAVAKDFSRQFSKVSSLKEHLERYEAAASHTRYRENRKKIKTQREFTAPSYRDG